jgi:hypothetical protein
MQAVETTSTVVKEMDLLLYRWVCVRVRMRV